MKKHLKKIAFACEFIADISMLVYVLTGMIALLGNSYDIAEAIRKGFAYLIGTIVLVGLHHEKSVYMNNKGD